MIASALVGLGKAFGSSRTELKWLCIELGEDERSYNNQVGKQSKQDELGGARSQTELGLSLAELPEARLGSFGCVCLLRLFDDCFVYCFAFLRIASTTILLFLICFEALCISISPL